jgi:hypothetical protein
MSDTQIRLECAKLAAQLGATGREAIQFAQAIYEWVAAVSK